MYSSSRQQSLTGYQALELKLSNGGKKEEDATDLIGLERKGKVVYIN
jgi:hypothetical protein